MGRKKSLQDFIAEARNIHGDKFDYTESNYQGNKIKLSIKCNICGLKFWQTPGAHLRGEGCPYCSKRHRYTTDEYIQKAKSIHGDLYDYSKTKYVDSHTKVLIRCKNCGLDFSQVAASHLQGSGCPNCYGTHLSNKDDFEQKSREVHGDKYDYSKVKYVTARQKVQIVCKQCGTTFLQVPYSHLSGYGCPECGGSRRLTLEEFISRACKIHGQAYDYSRVEYKNAHTKVQIKCNKCQTLFWQTPDGHLAGKGCPNCLRYIGEAKICAFLDNLGFTYIKQATFADLYYKSKVYPLRFDFYLPRENLLIEFNGIQHYEYQTFFHQTEEKFIEQQKRDQLKADYARNHNIDLLIIKYDENIEERLTEVLNMSRVKVTDDIELASEIRQGLKENNGYCPCKPVSDDTKCMCKEFREQDVGPCYCGLYVKEYVND